MKQSTVLLVFLAYQQYFYPSQHPMPHINPWNPETNNQQIKSQPKSEQPEPQRNYITTTILVNEPEVTKRNTSKKEPASSTEYQPLLGNPDLQAIQDILRNNKCNAATVRAIRNIIDSEFDQKSEDQQYQQRLSIPHQLGIHALINALLNRCNAILCNPRNNFIQEHSPLKLKSFKDFKPKSASLRFYKIYRFLARSENQHFTIPLEFDLTSYLTTIVFDEFFECNQTTNNTDTRSYYVRTNIFHILSFLATDADIFDKLANEKEQTK